MASFNLDGGGGGSTDTTTEEEEEDTTTQDSTSDTGGGGGTSSDTQFTSGTGATSDDVEQDTTTTEEPTVESDPTTTTTTTTEEGATTSTDDGDTSTSGGSGSEPEVREADFTPEEVKVRDRFAAENPNISVDDVASVEIDEEAGQATISFKEGTGRRVVQRQIASMGNRSGATLARDTTYAGVSLTDLTGGVPDPTTRPDVAQEESDGLQGTTQFTSGETDRATLEEQVERKVALQTPGVSPDDLRVSRTDEGFDVELASQPDEGLEGGDGGDRPSLTQRTKDLIADVQEEGVSSVERGGALSEAARNTVAVALGVYGDDPEELAPWVGISEERALEKETELTGPEVSSITLTKDEFGIEFTRGPRGQVNEGVVARLTEGSGVLSDEQREELQEDIEQRRERLDFGEELGTFVGDVTQSDRAGSFATGVGRLPADAASATAQITLAADTASEIAPNVPGAVGEFGAPEVAATSLETGGRGVETVSRGVEEKPLEFAGSLTGAVVGGALVSKAVQGAPSRVRGAGIRARGGRVYDFEDLSDPPLTTEGMELPGFTQAARRDPEVARTEFVEQAKQGPLAQGSRRPRFGIEVDPDSGPLKVDPELAAAIRGTPARARARVAGGIESVKTTPSRAVAGLDDAAFEAGVKVGETTRRVEALPSVAREAAEAQLLRADDAAFRAGRRVGRRLGDVEDFAAAAPQRFDEAVFEAGVAAGRRVSSAEDFLTSVPGRIDDATLQPLDDAAFRVGVGTGRRLNTAEDFIRTVPDRVDDAAFGAGVRVGEVSRRVEAAPGVARAAAEAQLLRLDDTAFRAGRRAGRRLGELDDAAFEAGVAVGEKVTDVENFITTAPQRLDEAAFRAGERTGQQLARVDDAAFEAGVRVGEVSRQVEALPWTARDVAGAQLQRLDDAAFEAGRRTGERLGDLDDAAFRAGERVGVASRQVEAFPGVARAAVESQLQRVDDAAFRAGRRAGRQLGELDDAAFRAGEFVGETSLRVEAFPGEARAAVESQIGRLDDAAFEAGVRTGERVTDLEDFARGVPQRVDDTAFRAGERVGEVSKRVEAAPGVARAATEAQLLRLDDAAFRAGRRAGRQLSELDDAAFRAGERVGEVLSPSGGGRLSDVRDLTLRVELPDETTTPVAFHGRSPEAVAQFGGFGSRFEAPEGGSELPGLFQSADLSPLRVGAGGESSGLNLPRVGLPTTRARSSRVLAEEDVEVGITRGRSRQQVSEFLEEDASRGESFIRTDSGGGPTPEQEAIAPPGSVFEESGGVFGVRVGGTRIPFTETRVGGEIIPGRLTRRAEVDVDAGVSSEDVVTGLEAATETTEAVTSSVRRQRERSTVTPIPPTSPAVGAAEPTDSVLSEGDGSSTQPNLRSGGGSTVSSATDESRLLGEDSGATSSGVGSRGSSVVGGSSSGFMGTSDSSSGGGSGSRSPPASPPDSPPSSPPSSPPMSPPSSPPGSPPSSPPGSPPSSPPGGPPDTPPTAPPTTILDFEFDEPSRKRRRDRFDDFTRDFEWNIATPEEVLTADGVEGTEVPLDEDL